MATKRDREKARELLNTYTANFEEDVRIVAEALDAARAEERENIIACIRSTTWSGPEEIITAIRARAKEDK